MESIRNERLPFAGEGREHPYWPQRVSEYTLPVLSRSGGERPSQEPISKNVGRGNCTRSEYLLSALPSINLRASVERHCGSAAILLGDWSFCIFLWRRAGVMHQKLSEAVFGALHKSTRSAALPLMILGGSKKVPSWHSPFPGQA